MGQPPPGYPPAGYPSQYPQPAYPQYPAAAGRYQQPGYSYPGYQPPQYTYATAPYAQVRQSVPHKTGALPLVIIFGGLLILFALALLVVALIQRQPGNFSCDRNCPKPPPSSEPLGATSSFTSKAYGFTVEWQIPASRADRDKETGRDDKGIHFSYATKADPRAVMPYSVTGDSSRNRSAHQVVDDVRRGQFPQAQLAYALPRTDIGDTLGFGGVYDSQFSPPGGQSVRGRVVIVAAVKKGVAVIGTASGPYYKTDKKDGHPNPAGVKVAFALDPLLETVRWPGDAPR
jgi:hypothetical protein